MSSFRGPGLETVERLDVINGELTGLPLDTSWILQGLTSNIRYATRAEVDSLRARQPGLGRPEATCAALIPIRKSAQWWELAQDERRFIIEALSTRNRVDHADVGCPLSVAQLF